MIYSNCYAKAFLISYVLKILCYMLIIYLLTLKQFPCTHAGITCLSSALETEGVGHFSLHEQWQVLRSRFKGRMMYELTDPPNPPGSTGHISCCSQPPIINQLSLNSVSDSLLFVDDNLQKWFPMLFISWR